MENLTSKQEKFSLNMASGMNKTDAYKDAYETKNMLEATIRNNAYVLAKQPNIVKRVEELRAEIKDVTIASVIERKEILTEIARDETVKPGARIQAVDVHNKLDRLYTDQPMTPGQTIINVLTLDKDTNQLIKSFLGKPMLLDSGNPSNDLPNPENEVNKDDAK